MARPREYFSEEDRAEAGQRIALLIQEIRELSGLSSDRLALALLPDIHLSGEIIRKYAQGKSPTSLSREIEIATAAAKRGWLGPVGKQTLEFEGFDQLINDETEELMRKAKRAMKDAEKRAVAQLQQIMICLNSLGWNDTELVAATIVAIRKTIPSNELTHGGVIDLSQLLKKFGIAAGDESAPVWISWRVQQLDEVTPEQLQQYER
jgi:hypothetical protein